jgi:outer membrane protein
MCLLRLSVIVLAVAFGQVAPQFALADNLLDVYRKAVTNDARYAAATGAYHAGIEKLPQGSALLLPTLALTGNATQYSSEIEYTGTTSFQGGNRDYDERIGTLTLSQPLYRRQNFAAYRQAKSQNEIAASQYSLARQELILRAAQTYFDLLGAQQVRDAASAHTAAVKAQLDESKARLGAGLASKLDTSEAKARAALARAEEIRAESDIVNFRLALRCVTYDDRACWTCSRPITYLSRRYRTTPTSGPFRQRAVASRLRHCARICELPNSR